MTERPQAETQDLDHRRAQTNLARNRLIVSVLPWLYVAATLARASLAGKSSTLDVRSAVSAALLLAGNVWLARNWWAKRARPLPADWSMAAVPLPPCHHNLTAECPGVRRLAKIAVLGGPLALIVLTLMLLALESAASHPLILVSVVVGFVAIPYVLALSCLPLAVRSARRAHHVRRCRRLRLLGLPAQALAVLARLSGR